MAAIDCRPIRPTLLVSILLCLGALGLTPRQIALVVNKNVPDSVKLAKQYAAARGIPDGRIISLDLPNADEVTFDQYERDVVPPIRSFLQDHYLEREVRCLVTFYGVPFRIRDRTDTEAEKEELADVEKQLPPLLDKVRPMVEQLEQFASGLDNSFEPAVRQRSETESDSLSRRATWALNAASGYINKLTDPGKRQSAGSELAERIAKLGGPAEVSDRLGPGEIADPNRTQEQHLQWVELRRQVLQSSAEIVNLERLRYDAAARDAVRRITERMFGPLRLAQILDSQIDYLKPGNTNAALDNELALLWFNYYPRNGPWLNPLNYTVRGPMRNTALMISRLDGPDPSVVSKMIQTSVEVEQTGLRGGMALNSFGYPRHVGADGHDYYRDFDQKIRDLGKLVHERTDLQLTEQYRRLFQHREVKQTALYCGWYSVRNYVAGMEFSPGAVGYHVASLEMVELHPAKERGWVHGLLNDGVVATVGPVAEPYLGAFPPPEEFFPLLMTGRLTLAEVYWKTEPTSSWMMCLVGDPLYTPYKMNPPLKVEDLPPDLQEAAGPPPVVRLRPATRPYSSSRPQ